MEKVNAEEYYTEISAWIARYIYDYNVEVIFKIRDLEKYITQPNRIFYVIIYKSICSLEAANIFIRNFDSKRNLHAPLFIILRSILSDIIIAEYIIISAKTDEEKIKLIEKINFDHIDNTIISVEKTLSNILNLKKDEKEEIINQLKSNDKFFNPDKTLKIEKHSVSINTLIRKIFSNPNDERSSKLLIKAYDLYSIFSKLEHLGELSFELIHRGFEDEKQERIRNELHDSIRIILAALNNYSHAWEDLIDINFSHLKNIETNIINYVPQTINSA